MEAYVTEASGYDLLPANGDLVAAEVELISEDNRECRLRQIIDQVRHRYDYVVIDCPPSLNMLTINAMVAADGVVIPMQCEYYALEGFSMLMNSIKMIQRRINRNLKIFGIAMTMVDARSKLSRHVCDEVNRKMPNKLFKTSQYPQL